MSRLLSVLFNRRLFILAVLFLLAVGAGAIQGLPRAEDPAIQARTAAVTTLYPGAAAERVEQLVSQPVEEQIRTLAEVDEVSSVSRAGVSIVSITLRDEITDVEPVWSRVRDELSDLEPTLPDAALSPSLNDEQGYAYTVAFAITWDSENTPDRVILQRYAEALAERLRSVNGTDYVAVHGAAPERVEAEIDEAALKAAGLSIDDVARALASADARGSAGTVANDQTSLTVELTGSFDSLTRLRKVPISTDDGKTLFLGDVATLSRTIETPAPVIGRLNGELAVFVGSRMQPDQRVDLWVPNALAAVEEFRTSGFKGVSVDLVFEQATYTNDRLATVLFSLLQGLLIVVSVLIFTMGLRSAASVGLAIPLTALMTIGLFPIFGISFHQMSIIGVIVALGLMVDNAIIMTNDIRDDLRSGHTHRGAVEKALNKLFFPLMASTATTILAFMPIVLLPGGAGEFVGPMSIAVICALISSFFVSMVLVPSMSPLLLKRSDQQDGEKQEGWLAHGLSVPWLAAPFRLFVGFFVKRPAVGIALSVALPVIGIASLPTVPTVFFPPADRDQFRIELFLPQSTVIEQTRRVTGTIEQTLLETEGVEQVITTVGAATPQLYYNVISSESANPSFADLVVTTDSAERTAALIPALQKQLLRDHPNASIAVRRYEFGPPVATPVELRIFGPELGPLVELGHEAAGILANVPGSVRAESALHRDMVKLSVNVNEEAAALAGLDLGSIADQLDGSLSGRAGGFVLEGTEQLPVIVRYPEERRRTLDDLQTAILVPPNGEDTMPLNAIGVVDPVPAWTDIQRLNGERLQIVSSYVSFGVLPSVVNNGFQSALEDAGFDVPAGYRIEVGGEEELRSEAIGSLLGQVTILLVAAVTILVLTFNSFRRMAIVFAAGVISLGLGFLVLKLTGHNFGFIIVVGVMGLIGVGLNDTIVILSAFDQDERCRRGDRDAIVDVVTGATARHIWSTTITTAGGFVPLMFLGGEFWPPFAQVFAGGLLLLTIVAFVFIPSAYRLFLARSPEKVGGDDDASFDDLALQPAH